MIVATSAARLGWLRDPPSFVLVKEKQASIFDRLPQPFTFQRRCSSGLHNLFCLAVARLQNSSFKRNRSLKNHAFDKAIDHKYVHALVWRHVSRREKPLPWVCQKRSFSAEAVSILHVGLTTDVRPFVCADLFGDMSMDE